jgi:hypothetical protein
MRFKSRNLALIAVTAAALFPAAASATYQGGGSPADGHDVGLTCGKDYSRNSVSGDYCVRYSSSPKSVPAVKSSPRAQTVAKHAGFSWGDAGAGAGGALALILAATGGTAVLRHRRALSSTRQHRSPATG